MNFHNLSQSQISPLLSIGILREVYIDLVLIQYLINEVSTI